MYFFFRSKMMMLCSIWTNVEHINNFLKFSKIIYSFSVMITQSDAKIFLNNVVMKGLRQSSFKLQQFRNMTVDATMIKQKFTLKRFNRTQQSLFKDPLDVTTFINDNKRRKKIENDDFDEFDDEMRAFFFINAKRPMNVYWFISNEISVNKHKNRNHNQLKINQKLSFNLVRLRIQSFHSKLSHVALCS